MVGSAFNFSAILKLNLDVAAEHSPMYRNNFILLHNPLVHIIRQYPISSLQLIHPDTLLLLFAHLNK